MEYKSSCGLDGSGCRYVERGREREVGGGGNVVVGMWREGGREVGR